MKTIFSKLAPEVRTELICHHLSSQQSEVLSKYLENIPQPVSLTSTFNLHNSTPLSIYSGEGVDRSPGEITSHLFPSIRLFHHRMSAGKQSMKIHKGSVFLTDLPLNTRTAFSRKKSVHFAVTDAILNLPRDARNPH